MSEGKSACSVVWRGQQIVEELKGVLMEALLDTGELILTQAQDNAPICDGFLRASGRVTIGLPPNPEGVYREALAGASVEEPVVRGGETEVFITFNTPYARRLHENLTWNPRDWKQTASGSIVEKAPLGGPKYLEDAAMDIWPYFSHILENTKNRLGVK